MLLRTLALAAALIIATGAARAEGSAEPAQQIKIHVVGNGWHAGLVLPAAAINALVPGLRERFPHAEHYEVGWGDMGFYQAKDITAWLAIEALFFSKGSLLHIVGLPGPALQAFLTGSDTATTCVSADDYQRMAQLIAQAFVLKNDGGPTPLGPGLYGDSQFYKAHGRYSLLRTCNRWSAEVLQAGGLAISPRLSLTAGSVLNAMRKRDDVACQPSTATGSRLTMPIIWRTNTSLSASGPKGLLR
jgi:uncharacterized protein (TIGR02117 family)